MPSNNPKKPRKNGCSCSLFSMGNKGLIIRVFFYKIVVKTFTTVCKNPPNSCSYKISHKKYNFFTNKSSPENVCCLFLNYHSQLNNLTKQPHFLLLGQKRNTFKRKSYSNVTKNKPGLVFT